MQISRSFSDIVLIYLIKKGTVNKQNKEVVKYGLEVFFASVIKFIVVLIMAFVLNLVPEILLSSIVFGILRSFAGGVHTKTPLFCLLFMLLIYFSSILLALKTDFNYFISGTIFIFCLFTIILYAPADIANKPIISKKQRKKLKIYSLLFIIVSFSLTFIITNKLYSKIIIFSCLLECTTLLPLFYRLTKTERGNQNYEEKMAKDNF